MFDFFCLPPSQQFVSSSSQWRVFPWHQACCELQMMIGRGETWSRSRHGWNLWLYIHLIWPCNRQKCLVVIKRYQMDFRRFSKEASGLNFPQVSYARFAQVRFSWVCFDSCDPWWPHDVSVECSRKYTETKPPKSNLWGTKGVTQQHNSRQSL